MRISSRALIAATSLASALALAGVGVAPSYAATPALSVTQHASSTDVQLGHTFTVAVDVTNNIDPAVSTITATDTLPAGLTFWSLKVNPPFDKLTTCTTPKKNQTGTISCTVSAAAGQTLPAGTFANVATVTLKARKFGSWVNTASVSAGGQTASDSVTINVHTGKGHPKTGQQNNGQNKGPQNGQGQTTNNGHPNKGNNGSPAPSTGKGQGHTK
jgi:uncharacterized repeat protein (TIGR01451 family)